MLQSEKMEDRSAFDSVMNGSEHDIGPAVAAAAASGMSSPRFKSMHPDSPTATCGKFFETLTSSDFYKNTKVLFLSIYCHKLLRVHFFSVLELILNLSA